MPNEDETNALIFFDEDSFEAAQYLRINAKPKFSDAKQ